MKVTMEGVEVEDPPAGWQRCDGSTILDSSIWAGERTPDLNNERRFLRGGSDTSVLSRKQNNMIFLTDDLIAISFQCRMTNDQLQDHAHSVTNPGHSHPYEGSRHK